MAEKLGKLTKVQKDIIEYCKGQYASNKADVALYQVGRYLRYRDTRTLESLERKGYIEWVNHSQSQISRWGEAQPYWALTEEALNA